MTIGSKGTRSICVNYEREMDIDKNFTDALNISLSRKEQERIDFYNTYDVMTGVRIAATLGGFFGLMVLLVVYKSKSKTEKALEDPKLAAAAVAEAEEEERQIAAAIEADVFEQLQPSRRLRRSLDTAASVSPRGIRGTRFSSVGGYSTLLEPPIRLSPKIPCSIDEDSPPDDKFYEEIYDGYADASHLGVPKRRASNVTCSSSGSSYLERRNSSIMLGLPNLPVHKTTSHQMRRRQSSPLPEKYLQPRYPIDIRVIQPTPGGSPCGSERALVCYEHQVLPGKLTPRLAPLASISSCNSSLANDYPDMEMQSYLSDSVFHDVDEYYVDTDDEVDPFSTDSDEDEEDDRPCCSKDCYARRKSVSLSLRTPLPAISDESVNTLVGASKGSATIAEPAEIPLADSASSNLKSSKGQVWSKETLF